MKRIVLSAILLIISVSLSLAQAPQAFKYQAIARDQNGSVLSDRMVNIRVSLLSGSADGPSVYTETHNAATNGFGLVNLDIGLGRDASGTLSEISWGAGSYFLKIEMDENGGTNFRTMGISQLLSVPYALYSGSAAGLVSPGDGGGVPSNVWSLFGNNNTNPPSDKLGTMDAKDLVVVTDAKQRMAVRADGNIEMERSLKIGEDMRVHGNVHLNTLTGSTTLYGPFTVANYSPSLLSGTLTVDRATDLNSSLNVDGITDVNSAFHVNNSSPSILSGSLLLNGNGTFNQHLFLDNASLNSTGPSNGALVVSGGVGILKNLNVGGAAGFSGTVSMNGPLALTDLTESTHYTTGALTVAGGVGIGKQIHVLGKSFFLDNVYANAQVTINANPGSGTESLFADYPLQIQGGYQGIAIKVKGHRNNANNYISFWDVEGGGKMWGRIEGQTVTELTTSGEYIYEGVCNLAEVGIAGLNIISGAIEVAGSLASSTVCAGAGACITVPIASIIIASIAKAVVLVADFALAAGQTIAWDLFQKAAIGVSYSSGAGDYAEWLPKANPSEVFNPGDIVGVRGGRISHNTTGAEHIMVISVKPIVLGNMPQPGTENLFEKVAFLGQVPVKVIGKVKVGDCILPSDVMDGIGIAVSPELLRPEEFARIAGIAWSDGDEGKLNIINVAVGMNTNEVARLTAKQGMKIDQLESQVAGLQLQLQNTNRQLARLLPGFEGGSAEPVAGTQPGTAVQPVTREEVTISGPADRTVVFFELTRQPLEEGYALAERMAEEQGIKLDENEFFKKMRTDPSYKEAFFNDFQTKVNKLVRANALAESRTGSTVEIRTVREQEQMLKQE